MILLYIYSKIFCIADIVGIKYLCQQWIGMSLIERLSVVVRSKLNVLITAAEDPVDQMELAYEDLNDNLNKVKSSIADVTTQKQRLVMRRDHLEEEVEDLNNKARSAVEQDREDLAEDAIRKKKNKMEQIESLNKDIQNLESTIQELNEQKGELESQIQEFKTQKEIQKARYQAAKTQKDVSEMATGVGEGVSFDEAMDEIEEEIKQKQVRTEALEEMNEIEEEKDIDEQLDNVVIDSQISEEMERLKEEVNGEVKETSVDAENSVEEERERPDIETQTAFKGDFKEP